MRTIAPIIGLLVVSAGTLPAQSPSTSGASPKYSQRSLAWQSVGSRLIDLQLAGPAGGAVMDVAFASDGSRLYAVTARGDVWSTADMGEAWDRERSVPEALLRPRPALDLSPPRDDASAAIRAHPYNSRYVYALGKDLHRLSDQGRRWFNLTADGAGSVIGENQRAIAFSPLDAELIVVANSRGLWRSVDGGLSWSDLNRNLPNLPAARVLAHAPVPKVFFQGLGAAEWDSAGMWRPSPEATMESWWRALASLPAQDRQRVSPWPLELPAGWALSHRVWRQGTAVSGDLTTCAAAACTEPASHFVSAFAASSEPDHISYAGTSDGHLWVSSDGGASWRTAMQGLAAAGNPIHAIFVDPRESRLAVVAVGGRGPGRVFRTTNGGIFWDDLSANLPDGPVYAVAANTETGSIYVASDAGVFYTRGDLRNPAPATPWVRLAGSLPEAPVEHLKLDTLTGTIYAAVAGHGIFRASVPDVAEALRVLNAADLSARAAAPGGLLTVIGASVRAARTGNLRAPVLASSQGQAQIQVPFEATGTRLELALETQRGLARLGIPLEEVSPAIFVDADGAPLLLDAAGAMLDSTRPARAGSHVLVLATGLGRVRPDWPTGLAAPLENPPSTIAAVEAYLDGAPLRVFSSTLAGGYIGVYLVEVELPALLNSGTAELAIAATGKLSNRVRVFLEP